MLNKMLTTALILLTIILFLFNWTQITIIRLYIMIYPELPGYNFIYE